MKRVLLSAMAKQDGLYWYEDMLFSGVGFELGEKHTVRSFKIMNGEVVDRYRPVCDKNHDSNLEVNITDNLATYELQHYSGNLLSGIGYTFDGDFCECEILFKNGIELADAWWDKDGQIIEFSSDGERFGEICSWYPNGILKGSNISSTDSLCCHMGFSENGLLKYLRLETGVVNVLKSISENCVFFPISNVKELASMRAADSLVLSGNDIDDDLLRFMGESGVFEKCKEVQLMNTEVKNEREIMKQFIQYDHCD